MSLVSIVIPVYNIEEHLRECLNSIIRQTYSELEIICVDDGSTDSSPEILKEYAARDGRINIITQKNSGPGIARNAGLSRASGDYTIFLDSDDWFETNMISVMLHQAEKTGADITICHSVEFDTQTGVARPSEWMLKERYVPGDLFSPEDIQDYLFQFTYGWPWDKLYRSSFIKNKGIVFPSLRNSEDLVFVFRSLANCNLVAIVNNVLVHHRINRMTSVSNLRTDLPDHTYSAVTEIKTMLIEDGLFETYKRSFMNWEIEFLVWIVANLRDYRTFSKYFMLLKKKWLVAEKFDQYSRSFYFNKSGYYKYLLAKYSPEKIFYGITKLYQHQKQIFQCLGEIKQQCNKKYHNSIGN